MTSRPLEDEVARMGQIARTQAGAERRSGEPEPGAAPERDRTTEIEIPITSSTSWVDVSWALGLATSDRAAHAQD
jgi:hypothetical protein